MSENRRKFLQSSAMGVAGASSAKVLASYNVAEPSARVRLGLIGCGGRGSGVIRDFSTLSDVEVVSLCDPEISRAQQLAKRLPGTPKAVGDPREVCGDDSVDAVVVATPDHWHTPASLLAIEAGKHVYVEKPCSHNVREGRLLVEAARRHKRHVQHGTQSRSHDIIMQAMQILRAGEIGDVITAKAWNVQSCAGSKAWVKPSKCLGLWMLPCADYR